MTSQGHSERSCRKLRREARTRSPRRTSSRGDAIGAGCKLGDVVNVVGTSTCIIAMSDKAGLIPGVCGVVPGSVHPKYTGIEAGLSATLLFRGFALWLPLGLGLVLTRRTIRK